MCDRRKNPATLPAAEVHELVTIGGVFIFCRPLETGRFDMLSI